MPFLKSGNGWGISLMTLYVVFLAFALTAIGLRLWARKMKKTRLRLNDWAVIIAWFLSLSLLVTAILAIYIGAGTLHIRYATIPEIINLLKMFVAGQMIWAAANTAVKISILDLYIQIFRNRKFRIVSYVLMGVSVGYLIMVVLEAFFLCKPFAYSWNKLGKGHCGNDHDVYLSSGIVNLFIDVFIVVLPMPMLWGLQLSMAKKFALTFIFGIGALICIITIIRLYSLANLNINDITYDLAKVALWTGLEPMLGIINACLPVIQPVVQKIMESHIFSRSSSSRNRSRSRNRTSHKVWHSHSSHSNSTPGRNGKKNHNAGGGGGGSGSGGDIHSSFHRLEGEEGGVAGGSSYPLSSKGVIGTLTQISGPETTSFSTSGDIEAQKEEFGSGSTDGFAFRPLGPTSTINVRRDWEVQSEPVGGMPDKI